ncbi:uncharacterized protein LOC108108466 isoform X2 [Drosophila eugracilis]|uniref:uncharacterized protein LOC108108466 isoform X2 n=1 Tax=Drosophila eugracilis TaxID=29029 RepID=UPI001BD9AF25|nr:uncharacterized protein LOC108108466 isoform X2 [Drosophila eugracilis]
MRQLQVVKYLYPRYLLCTSLSQRLMSKSGDAKSSGTGSKDPKCKDGKDEKPAEAAKKPADTPKKAVKETKVAMAKDETVITGGSKCKPTVHPPEITKIKKKKPKTCDEVLLGKPKQKKKEIPLTDIQGGDLGCPSKTEKKKPIIPIHSKRWQKISLFGVLPLIAILSLFVLSTREEDERLEFKNYTYLYRRTKPFWFKDGNRTAFHNNHMNALPPGGYEDEIDENSVGQEPESQKDKKDRLKEFDKVVKNWRKHASKREDQLKKEAAAAEKEARKQEAQ